MGDYSYGEHLELFGGPPERGEAYPSLEQLDNLRKAEKEHGPHHLGASKPETPAGGTLPSQGPSAGIPSRRRTGMACSNCGAPEDLTCQPWCLGEQYS